MARTKKWGECGSDVKLLWLAFLPFSPLLSSYSLFTLMRLFNLFCHGSLKLKQYGFAGQTLPTNLIFFYYLFLQPNVVDLWFFNLTISSARLIDQSLKHQRFTFVGCKAIYIYVHENYSLNQMFSSFEIFVVKWRTNLFLNWYFFEEVVLRRVTRGEVFFEGSWLFIRSKNINLSFYSIIFTSIYTLIVMGVFFGSNKRQNSWTDRAQNLCGTLHDPRE